MIFVAISKAVFVLNILCTLLSFYNVRLLNKITLYVNLISPNHKNSLLMGTHIKDLCLAENEEGSLVGHVLLAVLSLAWIIWHALTAYSLYQSCSVFCKHSNLLSIFFCLFRYHLPKFPIKFYLEILISLLHRQNDSMHSSVVNIQKDQESIIFR